MDQPLLCCPNCGAALPNIDPSREFVYCPYCGGVSQVSDLLADSDPIRIEKIRARSKAHREAMRMKEETKRVLQMQKDSSRFDEASRQRGVTAGITAAFFGASLFFLLITCATFQDEMYGACAVSALQTVLSFLAAIFHSGLMHKRLLAKILALFCMLLVLPWGLFFHFTPYAGTNVSWDSLVLGEVLPEPRRFKGWIMKNEEDHLSVILPKQDREKFAEYTEACKKEGFLLDSKEIEDFYLSYNDQGYMLKLLYQEQDKRFRIDLKTPIELGTLQWPAEPLGSLLPKPDSETGKLRWCHPDSFSAAVGDMPRDSFLDYVQKLQALGYNQDVTQTENLFSARNSGGVRVDVSYEGMNLITIYLELPVEAQKAQMEESRG